MTGRPTTDPTSTVVRLAMTVKQASASVGISRSKLYERMRDGDLASFVSCGRRLIRPEALEAMLARDEAARRA